MSTVFVLQHSYQDNAGCDETKFLGVYSSQAAADAAIARLRKQPGFAGRSNGFYVDEYELDQDHWTEGYVST